MYKKVKATKNNNLKKASVFAAMAVLASWGVSSMMGSESNSALAMNGNPAFFNWVNNRLYGTGARNRFYGLSPFGYNVSEPTLSTADSKSTAELFNRLYQWLCQHPALDVMRLRNDTGFCSAVLPSVVKFIAKGDSQIKQLFTHAGLSSFGASIGAETSTLSYILDKLFRTQVALHELLDLIQKLFSLPLMKNEKKLKELNDLKVSEDSTIRDVMSMVDLQKVNQSGLNSEAKAMVERAKRLYFEGDTMNFDPTQNSTFDSILNALTLTQDKSDSGDLNKLRSVLTVILQINVYINSFVRQCATFRTLLNWSQAIKAVMRNVSTDSSVSLGDKVVSYLALLNINNLFSMFGHGDPGLGLKSSSLGKPGLLALPMLGLSPPEASQLGGGGAIDAYKSVRGGVIGAFGSGKDPNKILRASDAARAAVGDGSRIEYKYSLKDAMTKIFDGDVNFVRDCLSTLLDSPRQEALKAGMNLIDFQSKATDAEKKSVGDVLRAFDVNASGMYRFVNRDGTVNEFTVTVDAENDPAMAAEFFGQPTTIVTMATNKLLQQDLKNASRGDYWSVGDYSSRPWVTGYDIRREVNAIAGELAKGERKYEDLQKKVKDIKEKKFDEDKKKEEEFVKSPALTQVIVFNGNETRNDSVTVDAIYSRDKKLIGVRIKGFDASVNKISPVLCPKTDKADSKDEKSKKKDIDLPTVDAANGVATIDLSSVNATGPYELHLRSLKDNKLDFLFKCKFFNNVEGIKHSKKIKSNFETKGAKNTDIIDGTPTVYKNSDGSVTFEVKLKKGVDGSKIFAVVFEKGKSPNLEKDQLGTEYDPNTNMLTVTTSPSAAQPNELEIHLYSGKLDEACYVGKAVANQSNTTDITGSDDKTASYSSSLAKSGTIVSSSGSVVKQETQTKELLLKLKMLDGGTIYDIMPRNNFYGLLSDDFNKDDLKHYKDQDITIKFVKDSGDGEKLIRSQVVKLDSLVSTEDRNSGWLGLDGGTQSATFRVKLDVPVVEGGCKLRIDSVPSRWAGRATALVSSDKVSDKTESDTTITLSPENKSDNSLFSGWFF